MKLLLNICLGAYLILSSCSLMAQETTTIYLFRHAEKVKTDSADRNPHLNDKGVLRSETWSEFFKDIQLDHIYATPYYRTIETVSPLAHAKGLIIEKYTPNNDAVDSIVQHHPGKQLLFVGHSNTVPKHVNHLIHQNRFDDMSENDNHSLFIVQRNIKGSDVVRIFVD